MCVGWDGGCREPEDVGAGWLDEHLVGVVWSFTPSSPGTWCFRGEYGGDSNYLSSFDSAVNECFAVTKASSSSVTTPAQSSIVLGQSNSDGIVVSGNATGGAPSGSVSFFVCSPAQLTAGVCASGGTAVAGNPKTLVQVGSTNTSSVSSGSFTPSSPGTWCFRGEYGGDSNYLSSFDSAVNECFTVTKASSSSVTTPAQSSIVLGQSNSDGIVVSGNATGGAPSGSVTFFVCSPAQLTAGVCASGGTAVAGNPKTLVQVGSTNTSSVSSGSFTPSSPGTWCFRGEYGGDSNYLSSFDSAVNECFTVTKASSSSVTTPAQSSIVLGQSNSDGIVVSGNATGGAPSGSVSFFVCSPAQLTAGVCCVR